MEHTTITPQDDLWTARRPPPRTLVAVLLAGAAIAGCGSDRPSTTPLASVAPPAQKHSCGTVSGPGARFTVLAGGTRCSEARRVFVDLFAGRGSRHQGADNAHSYTIVDGWACGSGAGGFGCSRPGAYIAAQGH